LTNTLTHKKEKLVPIKEGRVGIYSCGPTVYGDQHIGNMYAFMQWDLLTRTLRFLEYQTKWVMNITDVGHLTGDNEGNPDTGEDKMEKGARREKMTVWEVAEKYISQFKDSIEKLGIAPDVLCRATDNISEQIDLIKKIESRGFTYQTKMGVLFDTSKFPNYADFAGLKLDKQKKQEDIVDDPEKKLPWDFFLWVTGRKQSMMWDSPWGKGYPGWHIECTAMSIKYLGERFDIHTGGMEHVGIHHTNEVAQGFGAFGQVTANYWLHNGWLMAEGGAKFSKSLGNIVTVQDLIKKNYDPITLRYLFLNSHYHKGMNFSYGALDGAQTALNKLRKLMGDWKEDKSREVLSPEKDTKINEYREKFTQALNDDLNIPQALAVAWELAKSNIPSTDKYDLMTNFDEVLGLKLTQLSNSQLPISNEVEKLINDRNKFRAEGKYEEADAIRQKLQKLGYSVQDKN